MKTNKTNVFNTGIVTLFAVGSLTAAGADHQSSLRASTTLAEYPDNPDFYDESSETSSRILWREVFTGSLSSSVRYELNAYHLLTGSSNKVSGLTVLASGTDEENRNSKLEHHWHDSAALDAYLTIDRINLKGSIGRLQWSIGRMPVNVSTTYVFTPNDLFAPFRPHHSYREYKPGVDSARLDYALGELGQATIVAVAGYESSSRIGRVGIQKENEFSAGASSVIGRVSNTFFGHELALLAGKYGFNDLAGFSTQGELFGAVGLKTEGHQRKNRVDGFAASEVAVAFDYRISTPLLLQFEQFYHGSGYRNVSQYQTIEDDPHPPLYFLGTNYSALMLQYEATELTQLRWIGIGNHTDQSAMLYLAATHSLADQAEISGSFLLPRGKGPRGDVMQSEYGTYPVVLTVDLGVYF